MLTTKQKDDLNLAVVEYLTNNNFKETVEKFISEANI